MVDEQRYQFIEGMRGVAAVWVLLHHAAQSTDAFIGSIGAHPLIANGYLGVDFFFVLSGFIISHAAQRLRGRGVVSGSA